MGSKLTVSEQCAAASKKGNQMPACIYRGITSRDKGATIPLSSTPEMLHAVLGPTMQECCGQAGEGSEKGHKDDPGTGKPVRNG